MPSVTTYSDYLAQPRIERLRRFLSGLSFVVCMLLAMGLARSIDLDYLNIGVGSCTFIWCYTWSRYWQDRFLYNRYYERLDALCSQDIQVSNKRYQHYYTAEMLL